MPMGGHIPSQKLSIYSIYVRNMLQNIFKQSGFGKLKQTTINKLTAYYGKAVRDHPVERWPGLQARDWSNGQIVDGHDLVGSTRPGDKMATCQQTEVRCAIISIENVALFKETGDIPGMNR